MVGKRHTHANRVGKLFAAYAKDSRADSGGAPGDVHLPNNHKHIKKKFFFNFKKCRDDSLVKKVWGQG